MAEKRARGVDIMNIKKVKALKMQFAYLMNVLCFNYGIIFNTHFPYN